MNRAATPSASVGAVVAAAALLAVSGISLSAHAAGASLGMSAGADQARVDCVATFPCDRRSVDVKLYAGYQLGDAIELRAVYFDAGRFKGGGTTPAGLEFGGDFKVNGFGITAGCRWALAPQWSLAAHAGVASVRTRFDHANPIWGEASQTTTQPLFGVGLAYAINPAVRLGIDYDATRFQAHTTRGPLHMLGLSAQFSF
ncbi:MAG: outer membrane beta-barrel protein [Rhizobacter sp.]|nr:outer membrane beta-barrel protein [Rhizobacter sp.]